MSMDRIECSETAEEYARCRRADRAAVERLIAGSGIAGTSRVLEVGCGTGDYISEIHQRVRCECCSERGGMCDMIATTVCNGCQKPLQEGAPERL